MLPAQLVRGIGFDLHESNCGIDAPAFNTAAVLMKVLLFMSIYFFGVINARPLARDLFMAYAR